MRRPAFVRVSVARRLTGASHATLVCTVSDQADAATVRRRVIVEPGGAVLVEGPVELTLPDGSTVA